MYVKCFYSSPLNVFKLKFIAILFIGSLSIILSSCKSEKASNVEKNTTNTETEPMDDATKSSKKVIMFYGNSLTAGYRLEEDQSFPSLIEDKIDSLDMNYSVINAGLSGDTSYDGLKRLDWVLNTKVDVFILELGANDMLRGLPVKNTKENLTAIVEKVRLKYPDAKIGICAMAGAPNMGADYVTAFEQVYRDLAEDGNATYIPFFLEGVAGNPDLLLADGKHPNAEGQKVAADNIWNTLQNLL